MRISNFTYVPLLLSFLFTGCANLNSIHRQESLDENGSTSYVAIDAKQRLMISGKRSTWGDENVTVVCSEPSPDVFSVFSAALEGRASKAGDLEAALKLATGETGATVGIRTQSIQLLRDAMFRICEAYLAGGIDERSYERLLNKYQKSMVTLIAIEQLTGTARPSQIVLKAGAEYAGDGSALIEAKEKLDVAEDELAKANQAKQENDSNLEAASKELAGDPDKNCKDGTPSEPKYEAACVAYVTAKEKQIAHKASVEKATQDRDDARKVFDNVDGKTTLSTNLANQVIASSGTQIDSATLTVLASEVKDLVDDVFKDDLVSTCLEHMGNFNQSPDYLYAEELTEDQRILREKRELDRQRSVDLFIKSCTEIFNQSFGG